MCRSDSSLVVQMGNKFCALLLLLATSFLAQTTVAQYACACVRPLPPPCPAATYATPPMPTATSYPTHQLTGFLPQGYLPQYCQPQAYVPQGMLPPIYQPPTFVVPIPTPPKDCRSANTTVQTMASPACHPGGPFPMGPNHPPIVVQTVYVDTSENPDKKEEKQKKDRPEPSKKKRKGSKPQNKQSKRPRKSQTRRRLAVVYARDPYDPQDPSDPYDDLDSCSCCNNDYYES